MIPKILSRSEADAIESRASDAAKRIVIVCHVAPERRCHRVIVGFVAYINGIRKGHFCHCARCLSGKFALSERV